MLLKHIKELCREHGTTISALERECGFGKGTISKWTAASPSVDKVFRIAERFNVSLDWLLSAEDIKAEGRLTVYHDGDAVCGCDFHSMRKLLALIQTFANGEDIHVTIQKEKTGGDGALS